MSNTSRIIDKHKNYNYMLEVNSKKSTKNHFLASDIFEKFMLRLINLDFNNIETDKKLDILQKQFKSFKYDIIYSDYKNHKHYNIKNDIKINSNFSIKCQITTGNHTIMLHVTIL